VLRSHAGIVDCAVVGVPDPMWGDRVCAAVVLGAGAEMSADDVRRFARERLAPYKVPKEVAIVSDLPRNPMGKVTKPAVRELFAARAAETT
jgi:malonyl-CoA/methylmalonyl-CoA synthetase